MSRPVLFPCGGAGQPACPPEPCAVVNGVALYTADQMAEYREKCYAAWMRSATADLSRAQEAAEATE